MQEQYLQDDDGSMDLSRRSALKAGGFLLGVLSLGRFAGLAEAKAAGGSGLLRAEDYGIGGVFDDHINFNLVEELSEDIEIDGREYPATIEYWIGCESVGGPDAAKKTFQGYLIEDVEGDNGEGGNQSVMYVYEKRPVSFDLHIFVEAEACGEDYVKVGYEPGMEGDDDQEDDHDHEDDESDESDGDHEDGDDSDDGDREDGDGDGDGGDGGDGSAGDGGSGDDNGNRGGSDQGGNDGSGGSGAGGEGGRGGSDSFAQLFTWLANLFKF